MAAKFLLLTSTGYEARIAIASIKNYVKSKTGSGTALLLYDEKGMLHVDESPEEIDEMIFRAKYSTAAVVSKAEPAGTIPGIIMEDEKKMRWSVDYVVKDGRCWKRKIVEAEDIESALKKAKEELLAERVDAFIFTIDSFEDPDDLITEEEVEDEQ